MRFSRLIITCSLLTLTACGGSSIKESLGLNRKAPDEFKVVSRPPLSVPPQFSLRPPSLDAESPTVVPADKQAQSIITGKEPLQIGDGNSFDLSSVETAVAPVDSSPLPSPNSAKGKKAVSTTSSESGFMKNIGADKADPKIRETMIEQRIQAQEKTEETSWWDVFGTTKEKKDPLVNAKAEAERIEANKKVGKPVTEGETPEVKDKDRGLIGDIFGW